MTSTTYSAKTKNTTISMIISSIKSTSLLWIAYSFVLAIAFPVVVLLTKVNKAAEDFNYIECDVFRGLSTLSITLFTVVFAAVMFNIYHNKRSVDLYTSLPLKRQSLFMARYFAGLIMLIVPIVVFMIAGLLVSGSLSAENVAITFYKMLGFILAVFNGYSMMALISMLCGGVIDTLISYAFVNIGVAGSIYMAINLILLILPGSTKDVLYGISLQTMAIMLLSPLTMPFTVGEFSFKNTPYFYEGTNALADEIIIMSLWAVLTVIYFVAAMIIAKIRKNENVQSGFIFNFPKVIVQIIASVGFGLIAGFIAVTAFDFYNPKNGFEAMLQFMAGALLGTLGTFLISTLIYNRGVKNIGKSLPIFAGSFASLAVFYLLVSLGLVGGVMNVPDVDKIKSVSFSVNGSAYNINEEMYSFISVGDSYQPVDKASEDKQYIEKVVDLHQAVVDNLHNKRGTFFSVTWVNDSMPMYYGPLQISVVYELENGKKIERFYPWYHFDYESIKDEYNAILDTDVYKNSHKITKCTAEEANVSLVEIRQHKVYSNNKLFDTTQIDNYKPGIEKTEEFKALLSERAGIDVETNQIVSIDGNAVIRDDDLYDTEFINKLYTSLKEEFTADKSLSKTERRSVPEYVDTDNVPNDIAFSVRMDFNLRSDSEDDMYNALRKKYGFGQEVPLVVDKTENYIVTKESYPKTYKLIEEYIQSKDRAHVFIWQDSAILDQYLQK